MNSPLAVAAATLAAAAHGAELVEGFAASPVRVVVYEDLQCGDCAVFREMLDAKLLPVFGARVAFVHRDFPLAKHAWARPAAVAARFFASLEPALGVEYRRHVLVRLREIREENFRQDLSAFASAHGIDPQKALAALDNPALAAAVEKDFQEGVARGIVRTPTALVNGKPFIETFTFEEIAGGIDEALAQAR